MTDFPRAQELHRIFRDEAVARADRLTLNAVDRDGTDANIMSYGSAAVGEEVIGQIASVEEGLYLDSAFGPKLDRYAFDRYGMLRKPASPAFVDIAFSTATSNPTAFSIPVNTKVGTSDGREFVTITGTTFPAGSSGPISVRARSTLAGVDQNVLAGKLTSIKSRLIGSPANLTVTNPLASAGGANSEPDTDFKSRIRRFWVAARRGTKGAVETGALAIPGVKRAVAFEGLAGLGFPNRQVSLIVTDEFTDALVLTGQSVPSYATQSQAFAQQIFDGLDEYRCFGIAVNVRVAAVVMFPIALRLHFAAGISNPDEVALYARSQVVQFVNERDPGAIFDPADVVALLKSIPGLDVLGDEVASPPGTLDPTSPYQVLRTSLSLVTVDSQATQQSYTPTFI